MILKLFSNDGFQSPVVIDRAHRTLRPPPTVGAKPRAIIVRVHFYREKELILRLQRERQLEYKGNKLLIFPDYTPEVMRQRREYTEVLRMLRELRVEHNLLFPGEVFSTPSEAMTFMNTDLKN